MMKGQHKGRAIEPFLFKKTTGKLLMGRAQYIGENLATKATFVASFPVPQRARQSSTKWYTTMQRRSILPPTSISTGVERGMFPSKPSGSHGRYARTFSARCRIKGILPGPSPVEVRIPKQTEQIDLQ
ncbi:hypothetical protein CC1G_15604 [Coprinopsis cinerea okayama7|uniref:Uncharacterized protein n=1 Tax=Coprinopsis cinerea (strain Okayama-7 / 130 / ATCC MYA-4618 / FGSC 9003) TaxID=240176 RepID=D6RND4_COPC7|nr:hypothetical protein CC1G_15604 [Coprinopsis cinerea okayama7\|eukprot:XP_002911062.1 hypothetical protein CC1G_15604 [Coprinopsis cinerea okayama7\